MKKTMMIYCCMIIFFLGFIYSGLYSRIDALESNQEKILLILEEIKEG